MAQPNSDSFLIEYNSPTIKPSRSLFGSVQNLFKTTQPVVKITTQPEAKINDEKKVAVAPSGDTKIKKPIKEC